ncbi:monocarboxylate transporter 5-like isoform X3 [Cherax quadricarinatus]|uniref:monocarboxylate transporter 5-like isoform X3 n=1 Tax=Cherax quadricarinatus TaxID=27406 RepID=UPI00387E796F
MAKMCVGSISSQKLHCPNGGWGWMVAFGTFLVLASIFQLEPGGAMVLALLPITTMSFPILFSQFLTERRASSTTIAWIFNMHLFLSFAVGPLIGPFTSEFGYRKVCLFSTVAASLSSLVITFFDSIEGLMIFFSFSGLFSGIGCIPCFVLIPMYFDQKRGQAMAITMAGVCLGQIVSPPFVRFLLEQYSLKGACLIVSALVFNSCVGASLFQPVEWHMNSLDLENHAILPNSDDCEGDSYIVTDEGKTFDTQTSAFVPGEVERIVLSGSKSKQMRKCSSVSIAASFIDLTSISPLNYSNNKAVPLEKEYPDGAEVHGTTRICRITRSLIADLKIFKSFKALIIATAGLLVVNGFLSFYIMAPDVIQSAGYNLEDAAWCLSIGSVTNLVARISAATLSDCSWFNKRVVYMGGASLIASSTLAEYMGLKNMAAMFGGQSLLAALGHIILGPLLGLVRDVSGSYAVAMQVMSLEVSLSVVFWVFMPLAVAHDKRKEESRVSASSGDIIVRYTGDKC